MIRRCAEKKDHIPTFSSDVIIPPFISLSEGVSASSLSTTEDFLYAYQILVVLCPDVVRPSVCPSTCLSMAVLPADCKKPIQQVRLSSSPLIMHVRLIHSVPKHNSFPTNFTYRIRPNYRTVRLGFSNLQDTLICGQICIYLLRLHYKKDQKRTYLMMTMRIFLTFFTKAYVVGTYLVASTCRCNSNEYPQHMPL